MLTVRVGNVTVRSIVEDISDAGDLTDFFPTAVREQLEPHLGWLAPDAYDPSTDQIRMPTQSYLVETQQSRILVDTCIGNHKNHKKLFPEWHKRTDFRLLSSLVEQGISLDSIDYVMCTHLHADHCGWNTLFLDGRWVPSFPNADYIFNRSELEFAEQESEDGDSTFAESVAPILDAKQALIIEDQFQVDDCVSIEPTPGHTPGHYAVNIRSAGFSAMITGDLIHSPIQLPFPEWPSKYDHDPQMAKLTRQRVLETLCDTDKLMLTAHFPIPSAGHVIAVNGGFRFRYIDKG